MDFFFNAVREKKFLCDVAIGRYCEPGRHESIGALLSMRM